MIGMSLAVLLVTSTIMEVFTVEAMGSEFRSPVGGDGGHQAHMHTD